MNQERWTFQRIPGFHKWPFGTGYKAEFGVKKRARRISETHPALPSPARHMSYT